MPVYEIKNPAPLPSVSEPSPRKTEPVEAVFPVIRVRHLKRQWSRRHWPPAPAGEVSVAAESPKTLARMVAQVNDHLERSNIAIHLRLIGSDNELLLEIYDCSGGKVCEVLHDRQVTQEQFPALLQRLQQEVGLVIDTLS